MWGRKIQGKSYYMSIRPWSGYMLSTAAVRGIRLIRTRKFKELFEKMQHRYTKTRAQQLLRLATVVTIDMDRKKGGCCTPFAESWDPV